MLCGVMWMRDAWELYDAILTAYGEKALDRITSDSKYVMYKAAHKNGSLNQVTINEEDREILIITTNTIGKKTICSMPNETFYLGDLVFWNTSYWLITRVEIDNRVYKRGVMERCNILLKWQNKKGEIIERWAVSDNMASNSEGIVPQKIIDMPKLILEVKLPLDSETFELRRGKRFLIDIDKEDPNAYITTNRNIVTDVFDEDTSRGINLLTLSQTQRNNEKDNRDLMIADYFVPTDPVAPGINCAISYVNNPNIKAGGSYKKYTASFTDANGDAINIPYYWDVVTLPGHEGYYTINEENGELAIKAKDVTDILGTQVKIMLSSNDGTASAELYAKVVSILDG